MTTEQKKSLVELAEIARQEHKKCNEHLRRALSNAKRVGEALVLVKMQKPKGGYEAWVKKELPEISLSTARLYRRIAEHWNLLELLGKVEEMTIREARDFLKESMLDKEDPEEKKKTKSSVNKKTAASPNLNVVTNDDQESGVEHNETNDNPPDGHLRDHPLKLVLTVEQDKQFNDWLETLEKKLERSESEVLYAAVEDLYRKVVSDVDQIA